MDLTSIAVIVPVRDRPEMLSQLLESIQEAINKAIAEQVALKVEVIIADDRSIHTPKVPSGLDARVVQAKGIGPGAARNTGARAADTDWLLFTDSDCSVDSDWVLAAQAHAASPAKRVVQGNPTCYTRSTPLGAFEEALYRHMYSTYITADHVHTSMLDSRNLLIRRDALAEVGGFDTSGSDAMAESRMLARRLLKVGFTFHYAEDLIVRHEAPRTIEDEMSAKFRHGRGRVGIWGSKPPSDVDMAFRYFIRPMHDGIDPTYVIPVHLAFLGGYSHQMLAEGTDIPMKVLRHVPEVKNYSSVADFALEWLAKREHQ